MVNLKYLSTVSQVQVFPKFQQHPQKQLPLPHESIHKTQSDIHNQISPVPSVNEASRLVLIPMSPQQYVANVLFYYESNSA